MATRITAACFSCSRTSVKSFIEDDCPTMAAALSYYTVFSLPPLLVLLLTLLGAVLDPQDIQGTIEAQMRDAMGPGGRRRRSAPSSPTRTGPAPAGAADRAQRGRAAARRHRGVRPAPGGAQQGLGRGARPREGRHQEPCCSSGCSGSAWCSALAFILLVSLVVSAVLSAFGDQLGRFLPEGLSAPVLEAINFAGSLAVIALLFAAIFKVMPDARIAWSDVRVGAVATALLFVAGKFALGPLPRAGAIRARRSARPGRSR